MVDNESFLRDIISTQLEAEGYDVVQATNGLEGLEKANELIG